MNKKLIWMIPLGIVLIGMVILCSREDDVCNGGDFKAKVPNATATNANNLKQVGVYMDCSVSLKGYLGVGETGLKYKASRLMSEMVKRDIHTYGVANNDSLNSEAFIEFLDPSTFRGGESVLDKFIKEALRGVNDTSVVALVSDMVMSYGTEKCRKNKEYNKENKEDFVANINIVMSEIYKKDYQVVIAQYSSKYNGKYYSNYQENSSGNPYKDSIMNDRPYYIMLIGTESNLKYLLTNNCLEKPNNIYSTFGLIESDFIEVEYEVNEEGSNVWTKGTVEDEEGGFYTTISLDSDKTKFHVECPNFKVPMYLNANTIFTIGNDDVDHVSNLNYDSEKSVLSFDVVLKQFESLSSKGEVCVDIVVNTSSDWVNSIDIEDDVNKPIQELEGKTWGIAAFFGVIDDAYDMDEKSKTETISSFKFKYSTNN